MPDKAAIGFWLLLVFALILMIMGAQGSAGRVLAVFLTPARLQIEE